MKNPIRRADFLESSFERKNEAEKTQGGGQ